VANIISDIAGEYDTFMALLKKMPDDEVISVGDMVDRGPKSKEVIEFFMKNGKAILGNHEHMMIDHLRDTGYYDRDIWFYNGGRKTLESFDPSQVFYDKEAVPTKVLLWLERLPLYLEVDGCLVSHSFVARGMTLAESVKLGNSIWDVGESKIIWNRDPPIRREEYKLQIAGHNSQTGLRFFEDDKGKYALCIDDSRKKKLTGIHLPSFEIYQQDYIR
jgi:serine/threonine protein phosphatase 1